MFSNHILRHYPSKKYKLIVSNSPRNMFLNDFNIKKSKTYFTKKEIKISGKLKRTNKKIIGYFPTWRASGIDVFPEILKKKDLIRFNDFLIKNNFLLVIKKHPNTFKEDDHRFYNKESEKIYKNLNKLEGFFLLDYDVDLNSIIKNCEILVSDYSGAIFDYLLLGRSIIFYTPDLKNYKKQPGLYFNLEKLGIGPLVYNIRELMKQLNKNKKDKFYQKNIAKLRKKIFEKEDCFRNIIKIIN